MAAAPLPPLAGASHRAGPLPVQGLLPSVALPTAQGSPFHATPARRAGPHSASLTMQDLAGHAAPRAVQGRPQSHTASLPCRAGPSPAMPRHPAVQGRRLAMPRHPAVQGLRLPQERVWHALALPPPTPAAARSTGRRRPPPGQPGRRPREPTPTGATDARPARTCMAGAAMSYRRIRDIVGGRRRRPMPLEPP